MPSLLNNLIEKIYLKLPNNRVYNDPITGLKTRCFYDEILKDRYDESEIFVAYLDINSLKKVNDENSHHEGTLLIKSVANKLIELNALDVCRIGGDEFLLFADSSFDKNILDSITEVSYGYVIKRKEETLSEAVHKADSYMNRRKKKFHNKQENIRRQNKRKNKKS